MSGVIVTNLDGRITYVKDTFLRMFEYEDNAAVLGENAVALFATATVKKFTGVKTIIDEKEGETQEFAAQRKDGVMRWIRDQSVPQYDSQGKLLS